jgi:hypothetical protein
MGPLDRFGIGLPLLQGCEDRPAAERPRLATSTRSRFALPQGSFSFARPAALTQSFRAVTVRFTNGAALLKYRRERPW